MLLGGKIGNFHSSIENSHLDQICGICCCGVYLDDNLNILIILSKCFHLH